MLSTWHVDQVGRQSSQACEHLQCNTNSNER